MHPPLTAGAASESEHPIREPMRFFIPRFVAVLLLYFFLTAVGVVGYARIEGWGVWDSLYMTVITLTAVGYAEVNPLSEAGRGFTMVLLGAGITSMGIWFALLTALIVELDLRDVFRRRQTMKEIEKMDDHVIVCGAGGTGRQVVTELVDLGQPFVVIERDPDQAEQIYEIAPDAQVVVADATEDQALEQAGIDRARGLVTCLSADTDNLFVCLSARDLRADLEIVARAYHDETMPKLYRAGANHVVSPNITGAIRMASVLLRPTVVSFLDVATRSPDLALRMEQTSISEDSPLAGMSLQEARIPQETGLIVIALRKSGAESHDFVFNPVAETRLEPGDEIIVLGRPDQIVKLRKYVHP